MFVHSGFNMALDDEADHALPADDNKEESMNQLKHCDDPQ